MEETLVGLEVAKLLKENGFHISSIVKAVYTSENEELPYINNVSLHYDDEGWDFPDKETYLNHIEVIHWKNAVNFDRYSHPYWLAPTQSLAQKWLREVHNIHIIIDPFFQDGDLFGYNIFIFSNEIEKIELELKELSEPTHCDFKTYEEALEEGIKQALLLINNKN